MLLPFLPLRVLTFTFSYTLCLGLGPGRKSFFFSLVQEFKDDVWVKINLLFTPILLTNDKLGDTVRG